MKKYIIDIYDKGERKMQSCLGITLSDKLIKYAKVEKDANNLKVISFGVKFYEPQDLLDK